MKTEPFPLSYLMRGQDLKAIENDSLARSVPARRFEAEIVLELPGLAVDGRSVQDFRCLDATGVETWRQPSGGSLRPRRIHRLGMSAGRHPNGGAACQRRPARR
jgi:hypothetical protein